MSEAVLGQGYIPDETSDLMAEIEGQIVAPPGADPIISDMWEGFLTELPEDAGLAELFSSFQQARGTGSASERAGLLRTIFMADVLRGDRTYREAIPQTYEQWCNYFRKLGDDYVGHNQSTNPDVGARIDDLEFSINADKEVQTNIAGRYVSTELVMQSDPKFYGGVVWLDVGCGVQQGQHALALKNLYPIEHAQAIDDKTCEPKPELTTKIAELLARPSLIKEGIGLDVLDPDDQKSKRWVRASLRPTSELLNPEFMARYDTLVEANVPGIEARAVDITDGDAVGQFLDEFPDFRPNLITLYTFPHQLERHERELAMRNLRQIAAPDATLLLQDFAYQVSSRPNFLRYFSNWHIPYRYSMFRRDLATTEDYWHKQLSFNESHGNILKLSAEIIRQVMSA